MSLGVGVLAVSFVLWMLIAAGLFIEYVATGRGRIDPRIAVLQMLAASGLLAVLAIGIAEGRS